MALREDRSVGQLRPALFLDRDGIMVLDKGYMGHPHEAELIAGISDLLTWARDQRWCVVVVSNQSGVARGLFGPQDVERFHDRISDLLREAGSAVPDAYYYCPHHPEGVVPAWTGQCECRKPGTAMIERACSEHGLDRKRSYLLGDRESDIECAVRAGLAGSIQVQVGLGRVVGPWHPRATRRTSTLVEALEVLQDWVEESSARAVSGSSSDSES